MTQFEMRLDSYIPNFNIDCVDGVNNEIFID